MKLLDINQDDYEFIFKLTSDKKIMQYIVDGKASSELNQKIEDYSSRVLACTGDGVERPVSHQEIVVNS